MHVRECVQKPGVHACVHACVGGVTLAAGQAAEAEAVLAAVLDAALEAVLEAEAAAALRAAVVAVQEAAQEAVLGVALKEAELKLAALDAEMTSCYAVGAELEPEVDSELHCGHAPVLKQVQQLDVGAVAVQQRCGKPAAKQVWHLSQSALQTV